MTHGVEHTHADNGTRAAFWQCLLAHLDGGFISHGALGVVGVL